MSDAFRQTAALHTDQFEETVQAQRRQLQHASVMEADSSRLELRSMHHHFSEPAAQPSSQLIALEGMRSQAGTRDLAVREDAQVLCAESEQQARMLLSANQTWQGLRGEPRPLPTARTCTGQSWRLQIERLLEHCLLYTSPSPRD